MLATTYIPPDDSEIWERCYKLYIAECTRWEKDLEKLSDQLLEDVWEAYDDEAVKQHKTEFMRDARMRKDVRVWLEKKVVELERV